MKKQARLIIFIAVIMLTCLLALTLSACGENKTGQAKKASHIMFETPENSLANPISTDNFKFSDVKLYVVYDDGSKGKAVTFNESMLSTKNTGNIDDIPVGGKSRVIFTASYTVGGTTFEGTFGIYLKKPDNVEKVTYKFYTNGANVEDFELRIPVGTVFKTYKSFLEYLDKNHEPVAKTRYTLAGWLDTQGQDVAGMETAQIERNYGRYNMERNFVEIEVKKGVSNYFYATWSKNVAEVTFNYNFSQFSMEGVAFTHVTPRANVEPDGDADGERRKEVNNSRPTIVEYYTMGYDVAQRPITYKIDALQPTPLQEIVDGYTFEGWYTDAELTQTWSFSGVVKDNMTLYAKWARRKYSITLDLGGGFFNSDYIAVENGNLIEKDGNGKYTSRGKVERTSSLKDVNGDAIEVPSVVRYTELNYKASVFGTTNNTYYLLKQPDKINSVNRFFYKGKVNDSEYYYDFAGWYYDANFNKPFILNNNSFTEDLYLFAKWELSSNSVLQAAFYKDYLFKDCLELKPDGTYKITGINDKTVTTFKIPAQIDGIFVTEIGADAFRSCLSLLKVEIEGGESSKLSKIGDRAFAFCSKLSEINKISDGTLFNYDLFNVNYNNAQQEQYVHLPNLKDIGVDVFQGTEYLQNKRKTMNFLEYQGRLIQYIGDTTVTNIVSSVNGLPKADNISGGVVIGGKNYTLVQTEPLYVYTATGEPTLKYAYFPSDKNGDSTVKTINPLAFKNLTNLKSIVIPNTVKEIGDSCFSKCSVLSVFEIDKTKDGKYNLEEIGPSALADTPWLSGQPSLVTIGKILYSFRGRKDTTQVEIPDGIEIIADNLFMSNDNLRVITFKNEKGIKKIGKNAFNATAWYRTMGENNNGFVTVNGIMIGYTLRPAAVDGKVVVTVPNTIRELASYAFSNTNTITHISLPSSIEKIDAYAFDACTRLQTVSFGHLVLADESGTSPKNPVLLDNSENLSPKAFFNKLSDKLVSADVKLYFTLDRFGANANCLELARGHNSLKAYYENNKAFIQELKIKENGIRVKAGTLPAEYVASSGWTLSNYWNTAGTFDKKAIIQIEKTDGLIYEEYLALENVSDFTNDLTPSSAEDVAKYGMNVYNGKRKLTVKYKDANGVEQKCDFEYTIRPKITKITINPMPQDKPTYMSLATYFTTSEAFIYQGGTATISYDISSVAPQTVSLEKLMSLAKIEGNKDVRFTIENFVVASPQSYSLAFKLVMGEQNVLVPYEYGVSAPLITKIVAKNPIELDIAAEITKTSLTNTYLTMSRNDPLGGGQIYATDGVNALEGGGYEITGNLYAYNNVPSGKEIQKYIVLAVEKDEQGKKKFVESFIEPAEIGNYLRNQDITIADGSILLYSDDAFTNKLTNFPTSTEGVHTFYAKYSSQGGLVGGSAINYNVVLRTSQSLFTYTTKSDVPNPYGADFSGTVKDENGNLYAYGGVATITGIGANHWSTVSIPEYITNIIETPITNKNKVDLEKGIAYELDENGARKLDENGEPIVDTACVLKKDADGNVVVDENGNPIELTFKYYVVTAIGDNAFYNAETGEGDNKLERVYFSKYVTKIGKNAFKACSKLVVIGLLNDEASGVVSIGESAFEGCTLLQTVPFDSAVGGVLKEIGRSAFRKSGIIKFDFANVAVDEIAELLFAECGSLANVNLGNVTTIGNQAFLSCTALTKIVIPISVNEIGDYVFSACTGLKEIFIEDTDPNGLAIGGNEPFGSPTNLLKIYVDKDSVELFKANSQYAIYKDLITAKP